MKKYCFYWGSEYVEIFADNDKEAIKTCNRIYDSDWDSYCLATFQEYSWEVINY